MMIFLVSQEEYSFPSKEDKNNIISGWSYVGFLPNGNAIKLSSQDNGHKVYEGSVGYDAERAVDLKIKTKVFGGRVTYSEMVEAGTQGN
jgi:hypothetical protein